MANSAQESSDRSVLNSIQSNIEVRKMDFKFGRLDRRDWYRDNPILSAFIAVLSGTFPPGEQMFIDSVRYYRDRIKEPKLLEDVKAFTRQEAHHTHQHKLANTQLEQVGWKVSSIERRVERAINFLNKRRTPRERLAATVCLEHITAIVAEYVLTHPKHIEGMHPSIRNMLVWHAIEEIEHKSVAFDVYMSIGGKRRTLYRIMKSVQFLFPLLTTLRTFYLLWKAKTLPKWHHIKEAHKMLFGEEGMIRCIKQPFMDFYREDFHPNDHNNRILAASWKEAIKDYQLG